MNDRTFIPLHILSQRLGLPAAWLKAEAEAGRIPSLRTARRLMFNAEEVEQALKDRAPRDSEGGDHD